MSNTPYFIAPTLLTYQHLKLCHNSQLVKVILCLSNHCLRRHALRVTKPHRIKIQFHKFRDRIVTWVAHHDWIHWDCTLLVTRYIAAQIKLSMTYLGDGRPSKDNDLVVPTWVPPCVTQTLCFIKYLNHKASYLKKKKYTHNSPLN